MFQNASRMRGQSFGIATLSLKATRDCPVVHCPYEKLLEDLARAGSRQEILERPGTLRNIATALDACPY